MLFQINSMWQLLGWVLVFAGLVILNEIGAPHKTWRLWYFRRSSCNSYCILYRYSDQRRKWWLGCNQ